MKKLMITALMLIGIGISASAQNWGVGFNLSYCNAVAEPSFGIKALYDINESYTIAPSLNFYLPTTETFYKSEIKDKYWDINVDVHYNFYNTDKGKLYPLAGITFFHINSTETFIEDNKEESSESEGLFGINLGFGGQMNLTDRWIVSAEIKYQIIEEEKMFIPALSLIYKF